MAEIDPYRYTRSVKARRLRGAAALLEMLERIGAPNSTDHDVAHILVDNELELREMLSFTMNELAHGPQSDPESAQQPS